MSYDTNTTTISEMFEAEAKRLSDGYKTGGFLGFRNEAAKQLAIDTDCDCLGAGSVSVYWYTSRTADRTPIIRVMYFFPTRASRKVYFGNGTYATRKTWRCTEKEQKFPFTEEGLAAAIAFAESL